MPVSQIFSGIETSDGAGVRLTRMIGTQYCDMINPFLMLDRFDTTDPDAYIGGFPDHPHRGFETVTLMLDGRMQHRDSTGGEGIIGPGDVQWMTAGSGIIHSEIPQQIEGRMRGFQLWINLPAAKKMTPPHYQDIPEHTLKTHQQEGVTTHIIAGTFEGMTGPATSQTPIRLCRMEAAPNAEIQLSPTIGYNSFLCLYEGLLTETGNRSIPSLQAPTLAILECTPSNPCISLRAGPDGAAFLFGEGEPINEPVAKYGPFVMNTQEEIKQAIDDFRAGRFEQSAA